MDFHHQLKGAILDAVEEGLIERDPIGKAIIKGKKAESKKIQDFNQLKLHKRLSDLDLGQKLNRERFILLVAKTGMRFSEVLATAPQNLNFSKQYHSVNKTMDDKGKADSCLQKINLPSEGSELIGAHYSIFNIGEGACSGSADFRIRKSI